MFSTSLDADSTRARAIVFSWSASLCSFAISHALLCKQMVAA